jgi:hypothetical protein
VKERYGTRQHGKKGDMWTIVEEMRLTGRDWTKVSATQGGRDERRGELERSLLGRIGARQSRLGCESNTYLILASMATFLPNMVLMSCSVIALGATGWRGDETVVEAVGHPRGWTAALMGPR